MIDKGVSLQDAQAAVGNLAASFQTRRFDIDRMLRTAARREEEIWHKLIYEDKAVSPRRYRLYSDASPWELPQKNKSHPTRLQSRSRKPKRLS